MAKMVACLVAANVVGWGVVAVLSARLLWAEPGEEMLPLGGNAFVWYTGALVPIVGTVLVDGLWLIRIAWRLWKKGWRTVVPEFVALVFFATAWVGLFAYTRAHIYQG
jgi:hypothetical protein